MAQTDTPAKATSPAGAQTQWQQRVAEGLIAAEASQRSQWIEALLIPLLVMALTWLIAPQDPLTLSANFPWLWFAPLLVALRYGVLPGLVSGMLVLAEWLLLGTLGIYGPEAEFPREFFFAGTLLILLGGEFSDVWRDRLNRVDETNLYLVERLSGLTRRHLLLNLSHDRLEQEMLARPGSLRDAVVRLRATVIDAKKENREDGLPGVEGLLNLLTQYVNIEAASLYKIRQEGPRFLPGACVASFGETLPLKAEDELFALAMETRDLAHIAALDLSLERSSDQLVVAPLVSSSGEIVGVLSVSRLPFFSLNVENLQMMSVILAYYADCVCAAPAIARVSEKIPGIPPVHAEELGRLLHMHERFHAPSQIVILTFRGDRRFEMPSELMRIKRGLDLYWETNIAENPAIVVLMPFASESAKEGFLERIDGWMRSRFGAHFNAQDVDIRSIDFVSGDPLAALARAVHP